MLGIGSESYAQMKNWQWDDDLLTLSTPRNVVRLDNSYKLSKLSEEQNIALGNIAKDDFGLRVPLTDGEIDLIVSEWISNSPNVFGRNFVVDLGRNRAITKVRVIPGQTALNQPEYFVRGYRIEAAHENSRDVWRLLAEQPTHFNLTVDSQADSSWKVKDEYGLNLYREARYVRLTITRQDRSNWVALGDIEVYATGFHADGDVEFQFLSEDPVNIGRIFWETDEPDNTSIEIKIQSAGSEIKEWTEVPVTFQGAQYGNIEPLVGVKLKAEFSSGEPFSTPLLKNFQIDYDETLVATSVTSHIEPNQIQRKAATDIKYVVEARVNADDYGIDLIQLDGSIFDVSSVEIDGTQLFTNEYAITRDVDKNVIQIALESTILQNARVVIKGKTRLFANTELRSSVGSQFQGDRDGYINWQNAMESMGNSWEISVLGAPGDLLSSVRQSASYLRPGSLSESSVRFEFDVDNISSSAEVCIEIYSMNGNRVNRLSKFGTAGAYVFEWDGKSEDNQIVPPGLYIYEIIVEGTGSSGRRRGTCVVAY